MNDTNATNSTKKMLTRDPLLTAFLEIECRTATHCVDAVDDEGEPFRIWAMSKIHAKDIALALPKFNLTVTNIQEA